MATKKVVALNEIAKYQDYANKATPQTLIKDHKNKEVLISVKQINGYYIIVEKIRQKVNKLSFKSMYFEKGDLKNKCL